MQKMFLNEKSSLEWSSLVSKVQRCSWNGLRREERAIYTGNWRSCGGVMDSIPDRKLGDPGSSPGHGEVNFSVFS